MDAEAQGMDTHDSAKRFEYVVVSADGAVYSLLCFWVKVGGACADSRRRLDKCIRG